MSKNLYIVMESQKTKETVQNKLRNLKYKTGKNFGEIITEALEAYDYSLSDGKVICKSIVRNV